MEWTEEDEEAYWRMPADDEVDDVSNALSASLFPEVECVREDEGRNLGIQLAMLYIRKLRGYWRHGVGSL